MRRFTTRFAIGLLFVGMGACILSGFVIPDVFAEDGNESWEDPGPNLPEEPVIDEFSMERAAAFLDAASMTWERDHNCMTCHTNYAYLYARPGIEDDSEAHRAVRDYAESLVSERWEEYGPRWDAEVIATAAALAFNDAATTGELHDTTLEALDRMWTVQRDDGGWSWLKCGWPPMESDDHYGVTLAAIAVGVAPNDYRSTEQAQAGLQGIRRYLAENEPATLHHRAMMLWASSYIDDLLTPEQKDRCLEDLLELQQDDGGWALASLGDWARADGKEQDLTTSDGYGTGFVVFVMRRAGVSAEDESIQRGVEWLRANQRASGRWFTRSLNRDGNHYLTHAGSAMAIMALTACQ